jgi:hypothetical protein
MKISEGDRQIILGALDSLGVALADYDHEWTVGERTIYEEAVNLLTASSPCHKAADSSALTACAASPLANRSLDFAMLQKVYGSAQDTPETRYSPAVCMRARKAIISGAPDHNHVSTSYAERLNLTMRMSMRRFTRLTNGFSKKLENHEHALALYFMYYNFCRIHQTLRVTPAMEAGVSNHVWSLDEVIALLH